MPHIPEHNTTKSRAYDECWGKADGKLDTICVCKSCGEVYPENFTTFHSPVNGERVVICDRCLPIFVHLLEILEDFFKNHPSDYNNATDLAVFLTEKGCLPG